MGAQASHGVRFAQPSEMQFVTPLGTSYNFLHVRTYWRLGAIFFAFFIFFFLMLIKIVFAVVSGVVFFGNVSI